MMNALELFFLRIAIWLNHYHFRTLDRERDINPSLIEPMIALSEQRLCRYLERLGALTGEQK